MPLNFTSFPGQPLPQQAAPGQYNMPMGQPGYRGGVFQQLPQMPGGVPGGVPGGAAGLNPRQQARQDWRGMRPEFMPGMDRQAYKTELRDWRSMRPGGAPEGGGGGMMNILPYQPNEAPTGGYQTNPMASKIPVMGGRSAGGMAPLSPKSNFFARRGR